MSNRYSVFLFNMLVSCFDHVWFCSLRLFFMVSFIFLALFHHPHIMFYQFTDYVSANFLQLHSFLPHVYHVLLIYWDCLIFRSRLNLLLLYLAIRLECFVFSIFPLGNSITSSSVARWCPDHFPKHAHTCWCHFYRLTMASQTCLNMCDFQFKKKNMFSDCSTSPNSVHELFVRIINYVFMFDQLRFFSGHASFKHLVAWL